MDCCASCGDIFNCVAWSFTPSTSTVPSFTLPGGFDPWLPGTCDVVYNYGDYGPGYYGAWAICPNGQVGEVLNGSNNADPEFMDSANDGYEATIYYNGWNEGPCAQANGNENESSEDAFEYNICP